MHGRYDVDHLDSLKDYDAFLSYAGEDEKRPQKLPARSGHADSKFGMLKIASEWAIGYSTRSRLEWRDRGRVSC